MAVKEGNLEAPTRHPLDWKNPDFYSEESIYKELERVRSGKGSTISATAAAAASACAMPFPRCSIWWTNPQPWKWTASREMITGRSWTTATCATSAT